MDTTDAAYRELVERLLVPAFGMEEGPAERAVVLVGALPEHLGVKLPIPETAVLVGSFVTPQPWLGPGRHEVRVLLDTGVEPVAAMEGVAELAAAGGWTEPERRHELGGFASGPQPSRSRMYCRGRRGPSLDVTAVTGAAGGAELRMTIRPGGDACSQAHGGPLEALILPTLRAPAGVHIRAEGGSGGGGSWTSTAIAHGDIPVEQLAAHFGEQMTAAGWARESVEGSLDPAVSTWGRDSEWSATIAVVAILATTVVPARRWLMLRADAVAGLEEGLPGNHAVATISR